MSTYVVRIDVDGTVSRLEGHDLPALAVAGLAPIGGYHGMSLTGDRIDTDAPTLDICSARDNGVAPFPDVAEYLVIAVHEWGRLMDLPVNLKAWGLYGGSPLCGPAFIGLDIHRDARRAFASISMGTQARPFLPDEWVNAIEAPPDWISADVRRRMESIAYAEGLRWL